MSRYELREKAIHGTPEFPIKIYTTHFDGQIPILAPLHFHKEFEFCVVSIGKIIIQMNENYIELSEGEGVFINSETLHSIMPAENAESGFVAMLFDSDMVSGEDDIIRSKYISPLINGGISVSEKLSQEECQLVIKTNEIYKSKKYGFEFEVKFNIMKLLSLLIKNSESTKIEAPNRKREIVKHTIDYIHNNYNNSITLSELASHVYVSPEYLCRIFSQLSDVSPIEYLNRYRIMQGAKMLIKYHSPVSEISSLCGFNNSSYFNKMFMRFIGTTPTEYRKNTTF